MRAIFVNAEESGEHIEPVLQSREHIEEGEADRARVAFNSGNVLLETGELSAAKKMFERTLSFGEVGPYASKAHTQLGITMQRMGERRRMR